MSRCGSGTATTPRASTRFNEVRLFLSRLSRFASPPMKRRARSVNRSMMHARKNLPNARFSSFVWSTFSRSRDVVGAHLEAHGGTSRRELREEVSGPTVARRAPACASRLVRPRRAPEDPLRTSVGFGGVSVEPRPRRRFPCPSNGPNMVSVLADAALKTKPPPRVGVGKMVAPRANTTRMEDFEVQRKLGQGSFGVVYAVTRKRDLAKRRTFVIKQVELGPRRSEQEAAIDECRVLSKMDSKYVVKYFESFITKGSKLCIVMEYAPKVRFRRVRREPRKSLGNATTFLQVAVFVFVFFLKRGTRLAAPARLAFGFFSPPLEATTTTGSPHHSLLRSPRSVHAN